MLVKASGEVHGTVGGGCMEADVIDAAHDVIREGVRLAAGNDGNWGSQAVDLAPAQGAVIELTTAEDGLYPIVTHAFNFPGRGAVGLLQAGALEQSNVDLSEELVNMIIAQRYFQANAQAIRVEDEVTQSIINIR